jgi:uncharacterized protein YyaL (SSP411 family)
MVITYSNGESKGGTPGSIVASLDAWLETMRGPGGYGGPVAHWWQNCFQFTGAGLDWRYEGIIIGYLNLYRQTGDEHWLLKARRAGDDLVRGQLPTGNFRNSCFELNPYTGGTPHEAACDLALLHLAEVLRKRSDPIWQTYLATAERNIRGYYIEWLWDSGARAFRDHPRIPGFVPNKAATLVEALLKLAALTGDEALVEHYALPTLEAILAHQVRGDPLDGAIHQHSQNGRFVARFFPYYIARCIPGLVAGYERTNDERYLDAARRAMAFVLRWRYRDGSFPQVVYPGGQVNRYPQWIAAVGDILRAMALLAGCGFEADPQPTLEWLLQGQEPTGAFRTAWGFASQISQRKPCPLPEFRDLLPVVGWSSMAFRYLTEALSTVDPSTSLRTGGRPPTTDLERQLPVGNPPPFEAECGFRGQRLQYYEDTEVLELRGDEKVLYRWRKGVPWAEVCEPCMYLK